MKKYISKFRTFLLFVNIDGRNQAVKFHDMGALEGCSVFVTSDEKLQNALDNDPSYGYDFVAEDENGDVVEQEVPARVYDKVYGAIKRTQYAIDVLVKEYGIKRSELRLKEDVLRVADELNISFPDL